MITFIKKLFGLEKPAVAEAKTEAPYKVETPAPEAVVVKNAEILPVTVAEIPVTVAEIPVTVAPKATVKKQQPKKKPVAVKAPAKPRTPRQPTAK
jgi:hypothetical protein